MGALGAGCVPGACPSVLPPGARLQACPIGGLPVEGPSADSLVAALWAVLKFRWLLREACSLEALAADVAPGKPGRISIQGVGRALARPISFASIGQSHTVISFH